MCPGSTGTGLTGQAGLQKKWPDFMNILITGDVSWVYGYKSHRTCWTPQTVTLTLWKPLSLVTSPGCTSTCLTGHAGLHKQWPWLYEDHNYWWRVLGVRVQVSQEMLDSTNIVPDFMNTIISGDESWVYGYKSHRTCCTPHRVTPTSWTP